jgi:hypothetical protein
MNYAQIPLEQWSNDFLLGHVIHYWKNLFEGYKILPSHAPNIFVLRKI